MTNCIFINRTMPAILRDLIPVALFLCIFTAKSQQTFQYTIGAGGIDKGNAVIVTSGQEFVLCGESCNTVGGKGNAFITKLHPSGQTDWAKTYGNSVDKESLNDIKPVSTGGFIAVGERYPEGKGEAGVLLKTDASGNMQWWKEFDHFGNEAEGFSILEAADMGFVIAGVMKEPQILPDPFFTMKREAWHLYVLKTDREGNSQWAGRLSGNYASKAQYIEQTKDGGYIITGHVYTSAGDENSKICLMKLNGQGAMQWFKVYDNEGKKEEAGMAVTQTPDNGFMVCGTTHDAGQGDADIFLLKTNSNGDILWAKTYGGVKTELAKSMKKLPGGGYIITGATSSMGAGSYDAFLLKTDEQGHQLWFKTYGSNFYEIANSVTAASDGFSLAGFTINSGTVDILCIKTDKNGSNAYAGSHDIQQGSFPLKAITHEAVKWEFSKNSTIVKITNENGTGAEMPSISQKTFEKK